MLKTILPEFIRRLYILMTPLRLIWILTILAMPVSVSPGDTYIIEPGDTLSIVVLDHPSYSRTLQVTRDGHVIYLGGRLEFEGKSLQEAADLIQDQIRTYGRTQEPVAIVDPVQGKGYLVWGAVTVPNRFPLMLHDKIGLYEALAKAGGMAGGADRQNVKLIRADKSIEIYDLSASQEYREIFIGDGDIVFVPALDSVQIHGHVKKPGSFLIRDKIRIDHALAMADGPLDTPDSRANLENVKIFKANGESTELNLADYAWKDNIEDTEDRLIYLKNQDVVYVPPLAVAEVQGQVQVPGKKIYFHHRIRVNHALAQAGGPDTLADLRSVIIVRKRGETIELNLDEKFWKNLVEEDDRYYLRDGDTVYIPSAFSVEPVNVLGYVRNPGPYRIRDPITPREGISRAGGFEQLAKREEIKVWRKNGTIEEIILDWGDDENSAGSKTLLYPGDSLEIGKRFHVDWSFVLSTVSLATTSYLIVRDILRDDGGAPSTPSTPSVPGN